MTRCKTSINSQAVLVAVSEYGEFSSMFGLCARIEDDLGLHPVFVFPAGYGKINEHSAQVRYNNWSWLVLGDPKSESFFTKTDLETDGGYYTNPSRRPVLAANDENKDQSHGSDVRSGNIFSDAKWKILEQYFRWTWRQRAIRKRDGRILRNPVGRSVKHAAKLIDRIDPCLTISGQDYALSVTSILSKEGERKGIKTLIIPYSMPPTTKEIIESYCHLGINKVPRAQVRLLNRLFPHWIYEYRGSHYTRLRAHEIFNSERHELSPPLPWTPNSGRGVVLAPSQQAYDYYVKSGIAEDQLRVTGATWNDALIKNQEDLPDRKVDLVKTIKNRFTSLPSSKKHIVRALKDNQKIVVVSWPPNQWPRAALGCDTYQDLCQQFIDALDSIQSSGTACVVVSLHPTITDQNLLKTLKKQGLMVARRSLMSVIDCADVFVSTVSSTTFWALQCGIPSINFDGYLYSYDEFDAAGASTVTTPQAMRQEIIRLLSDDEIYKNTRRQIEDRRMHWTMMDGDSMKRILDTIREFSKADVAQDVGPGQG